VGAADKKGALAVGAVDKKGALAGLTKYEANYKGSKPITRA
jgi:hypothetical protein